MKIFEVGISMFYINFNFLNIIVGKTFVNKSIKSSLNYIY